MSNSNSIISKMYENFLARDLTYIFAGGLLLTNINYACNRNFKGFFNYITENLFKFIIFLGVSYFIGLITQEGLSFINIKTKSKKEIYIIKTRPEIPSQYKNYCSLMTDIEKYFGLITLKEIERTIYLKHIGTAIGSASLISSIILLFPLIKYHNIKDFILFLGFLIITIICLIQNREKLNTQNKTFSELAEEIVKIKKSKK